MSRSRLALALLLSAPAAAAERVRLHWYSGLPVSAALGVAAEYERLNPGVELRLARPHLLFEDGPGRAAAWREADVITELELPARARAAGGALAPLPPSPAGTCAWSRGPGGGHAFTHAVGVPLLLHPDAAGPDAPATLAELAAPRWKGKTALLAPSSSAESVCLYRWLAAAPGLGLRWLERMRENDVLLLLTRPALWDAVESGLRPVAWGARESAPPPASRVAARPAADAGLTLLYASAVNARAPHPRQARAFLAWLLEPSTQRLLGERGLSLPLLGDACGRLGGKGACGRGDAAAAEADALRRRAWAALLGPDQSSR
jgi:hypothetical protein